jgi:hypothetical protein
MIFNTGNTVLQVGHIHLLVDSQASHGCSPLHFDFRRRHSSHALAVRLTTRFFDDEVTESSESRRSAMKMSTIDFH